MPRSFREWASEKALSLIGFEKAIQWVDSQGPMAETGQGVFWGQTYADRAKYATEIGNPLNAALIMAAVEWVVRNIHEAPLYVVTRNERDRVVRRTARHAALSVLSEPNEYYDGKSLMGGLAASWTLNGNAYVIKKRSRTGILSELWWEPHTTIRARWPGDNQMSSNATPRPAKEGPGSEWISFYEVWRRGHWMHVPTENVVHIRRGMDPARPRYGINSLSSLLAEIFTDLQRSHFSATVLSNMGMIPYVVSPREGSHITPQQADKLKHELVLRGKQERGTPIVAGRGIRIDELGIKPKDMDLSALAKIPEERIASVLGPNAHVLGFVGEKSPYSTYVEAREDAYESFLIPMHKFFAKQLTSGVFSELDYTERGLDRVALEYDWRDVAALQDQRDKLYVRVGRAFRDGVLTRYEAKEEVGHEADLERDDVYVQDLLIQIKEAGGKKEPDLGLDEPSLPTPTLQDGPNRRPMPHRDKGPVLGGQGVGPGKGHVNGHGAR